MSPAKSHVSDETRRFHQIVHKGSLEEVRAALANGTAVNAPGHCGATALMEALDAKDLAKVKLLIQHGADPELTDDFNATSLRHAVDADFADGVQFLLSMGVDRGFSPRYPLKKIDYGSLMSGFPEPVMPAEMKLFMSESDWKAVVAESRKAMKENGQSPVIEPTISAAQSVEVLKLFLLAGDDLNLASTEMKRGLLGLPNGGELTVAPAEYQQHKSPSYGSGNPERMDFPFWRDMIRTGVCAYTAQKSFNDPVCCSKREAVWCYSRFGSSLTQLSDGRFVQIAGEHEDFYDPDFYIYNDVVVHDGKGDFEIYGYPRDVFPPTDFHTATLCPDGIYLIGCLGYLDQRRPGFTPVYRLALESWQITCIQTNGDMPGWIHRHRARYLPERNAISISGGHVCEASSGEDAALVRNEQPFVLDLSRFRWERME